MQPVRLLLLFLLLMLLGVEAWRVRKGPSSGLRLAIIRCCGKRKCSVTVPKSRPFQNSTHKISTSVSIPAGQSSTRNSETTTDARGEVVGEASAAAGLTPVGTKPLSGSEEATTEGEAVTATQLGEVLSEANRDGITTAAAEAPGPGGSSAASSLASASMSTISRQDDATVSLSMANETVLLSSVVNSSTSANVNVTTEVPTSTTTTSTSTTTSPCKDPCSTFKNATKYFNASNPLPKGSFLVVASRMYFRSASTSHSLYDAVHACLKLNMSLPMLNTADSITPLMKWIATSTEALEFWTSGANEGDSCEAEMGWCSSGKQVRKATITTAWADAAPKAPDERCLTLELAKDDSFGLGYANCTARASVLCEPGCPSATCPATCAQTLFDDKQMLKDSHKMGFWAKDVCGSNYLFSNLVGNWEEAHMRCCSLGMAPILFDTKEEFDCLSNLTKSGWKYNFNYWTAGTQRGCKGQWAWCSAKGNLPLPDNLTWAFDQPDNRNGSEDCIQMRLLQNATGIVLFDRPCTEKYVIACEGTPQLKSYCTPKCPNISIAKNTSLFLNDQLKDFYGYGLWHSFCGRTFLFSKANVTWERAQMTCRMIGTILLAVEYEDKDECLSKNVKKYKKLHGIQYWTSGTDFECKDSHYWCGVNRTFTNRNMTWGASKDGDCVTVTYGNSSLFQKSPCDASLNFICEVRNTGTYSQGIQNECMAVWNISIADMLNFDAAYNATVVDRKMKCFIKCVGENLEIFSIGGMPPSAKMLRMIEEITKDDDSKTQQGFQAYDECGRIRREDECDTASDIYVCGREKAPAITQDIYTIEKRGPTVYSPPVPCIATPFRVCRLGGAPCAINATLRDELLTTNASVAYKAVLYYTKSGEPLMMSKVPLSMTKVQAQSYCCSVGMRLIMPRDAADVAEIIDRQWPYVGGGQFAFGGESYANGDGTDSWCDSNEVVNNNIYDTKTYPAPTCNVYSSILLAFCNDKVLRFSFNAQPETAVQGLVLVCR